MKPFNLKIAIFTLTIVAIASASAFANDASNETSANPPADSTEVINAQMDVTKAEVNQLMQELDTRKPDDQYRIADYRENSPKFNHKIEQGLMLFEFQLEHSVMKKVKPLMDRYNSIYLSKEFSADQKKIILSQQLVPIQVQLGDIDAEYQHDILQVYGLAGNLPYDFQRIDYFSGDRCTGDDGRNYDTLPESIRNQFNLQHPWRGCEKYSIYQPVRLLTGVDTVTAQDIVDDGRLCVECQEYASAITVYRYAIQGVFYYSDEDGAEHSGADWLMKELDDGAFFSQVQRQLFVNEVYPIVAHDCHSQLCVDLQTADIGDFLKLVNSDVDRTIPITLMDGTKLQLKGARLDLAIVKKFLSQTNYPVSLPFDTN